MCTQEFGPSLTELCGKFPCAPEAVKLAEEFPEPAAFIAQLRGANMSQEAVQALARMLPAEKAVEWAGVSAQMAGEKAGISNDELHALGAAKEWSLDPTEAKRKAAELAAAKVPASTPAMWAANAAAWSEPMQLPEGVPPLPIAGDLPSRAVVGAVMLSAVMASTGKKIEVPDVPVDALDGLRAFRAPGAALGAAKARVPDLPVDEKKMQEEMGKMLSPFLDQGVGIASSVEGFSCNDPRCKAAAKVMQ